MARLTSALYKSVRNIATMLTAGLVSIAGPATAIEVTGSFTGWWGTPDLENHGVVLAVSELPNGDKTGAIFFALFDPDESPSWLFAQGPIEQNTIQAELYRLEGVMPFEANNPDLDPREMIGTLEIEFDSCLEGNVLLETTEGMLGMDSFRISRLSNQPGNRCSGGIGDDVDPGMLPREFEIDLMPTGEVNGASGEAVFEIGPDRSGFEVEVENLPDGQFEVQVGEVTRAVVTVGQDGEAEIEFRSPSPPGTLLLDFDPRGKAIDVVNDAGVIVLTGLTPEEGEAPPRGDAPPFGDSEIEVALVNLGEFPDAEAEAEFEQGSERVTFAVEVDDLPAGNYTLAVGGLTRGVIEVEADDGEGDLEFSFPPRAGEALLNFDPRGDLIEIFDGATPIFSVDFPAQDENGDNGDDGDLVPTDEIELALTNAGVFPAASAEAEFVEGPADRREFTVRIEGVPLGIFLLFVGEAQVGAIQVETGMDGPEGALTFRDPVVPGTLEFVDPRGKRIEIQDAGGRVIFFGNFPDS